MERLCAEGNVRVPVVYFKLSWQRVGRGRDFGFDKLQPKVTKNLFDQFLIMDEANDMHGPLTFGAGDRVDFADLLNQSGPIRVCILIRFLNESYPSILRSNLPF